MSLRGFVSSRPKPWRGNDCPSSPGTDWNNCSWLDSLRVSLQPGRSWHTYLRFQTKYDFVSWAGAMSIVLLAMVAFGTRNRTIRVVSSGLLRVFFPRSRVVESLYAAAMAAIFCVYIVIDTQMIVSDEGVVKFRATISTLQVGKGKIRLSEEQYIIAALSLYMASWDLMNTVGTCVLLRLEYQKYMKMNQFIQLYFPYSQISASIRHISAGKAFDDASLPVLAPEAFDGESYTRDTPSYVHEGRIHISSNRRRGATIFIHAEKVGFSPPPPNSPNVTGLQTFTDVSWLRILFERGFLALGVMRDTLSAIPIALWVVISRNLCFERASGLVVWEVLKIVSRGRSSKPRCVLWITLSSHIGRVLRADFLPQAARSSADMIARMSTAEAVDGCAHLQS
eukprot:284818773_6